MEMNNVLAYYSIHYTLTQVMPSSVLISCNIRQVYLCSLGSPWISPTVGVSWQQSARSLSSCSDFHRLIGKFTQNKILIMHYEKPGTNKCLKGD